VSEDTTPVSGASIKKAILSERTKAVLPLGVIVSLALAFAWWTNSRLSALEIGQAGATVWQASTASSLQEMKEDIRYIRDHLK
jgi:hypothetical protein